jgi:deoxyribodipyrimidine photo-lyase
MIMVSVVSFTHTYHALGNVHSIVRFSFSILTFTCFLWLNNNKNQIDSLSGAADWARESLELHASDEREHLYTWKQLEKGMTHDDLWNAAQLQLVTEGQMHGFLRMYWAKKILEWTSSPAYALSTAQYFNDRYAYDGNDPNGFVGVGWSIMGIHDMGWKERPIFGKSEYISVFFVCSSLLCCFLLSCCKTRWI